MSLLLWNYDIDDDCYRVRLMAALAGIPLRLRSVDAFPGDEPRGAQMMALNPLGRLPVLEDGTLVLVQTGAILLYLARKHQDWLPSAPEARAQTDDWLLFSALDLAPASQARACAMLGAPGDVAGLRADAARALTILEDHMVAQGHRGAEYVAGTTPSVADVALFPAFALSRDFNLDHDGFPALRLWSRRIRRLPGFITMPGIPDYG